MLNSKIHKSSFEIFCSLSLPFSLGWCEIDKLIIASAAASSQDIFRDPISSDVDSNEGTKEENKGFGIWLIDLNCWADFLKQFCNNIFKKKVGTFYGEG
jgi:hypothetical protein